MKNYICSIDPNNKYFVLTTIRFGSKPSYNIKYFFGEVEQRKEDYVLFHNINSDRPVRASKVHNTGYCSYYNESEIESDCLLEGVIRKSGQYEYYVITVEYYGKKRIDIIKPDRSTQLSLINKRTDIICESQNIGSFSVEPSKDDISDIMRYINNIVEEYNIRVSSFSPIEKRMFYSTYDRYLKKAGISVNSVDGFKIMSNKKFDISNVYKN